MTTTLTFIGFGEAAQAFATGLKGAVVKLRAYDIKNKGAECSAHEVVWCDTAAEAVENADVILSMVTADQALAAGQSVANNIAQDVLYFDCNSCAPDTKRRVAEIIEAAGGRYVDVAVMAPVHPTLHKTPLLVSGHAEAALNMMTHLHMNASEAAGEVGTASAIKMVRSIMIKGFEALTAECVLAGRKAGVEEIVLGTLDKTFKGFGWEPRAAYMLERMIVHGERRAAEMQEVALMLEQLGLPNTMARAATDWQQAIGELQLDPEGDSLGPRADSILAMIAPKTKGTTP